jgi:hypothetical protein
VWINRRSIVRRVRLRTRAKGRAPASTYFKEINMASSNTSKSTGNQQSAETRTEAEKADTSRKTEQSSGNAKSRIKAGKDSGAGGGAKQKQRH